VNMLVHVNVNVPEKVWSHTFGDVEHNRK
jgi:hypothetical protein